MSNPMDEYERLLREVEQALNAADGSPAAQPVSREVSRAGTGSAAQPTHSRQVPPLPAAVAVGATAAGAVWLLFLLLPVLGAISGALGAFLGAFLATLVVPRVIKR